MKTIIQKCFYKNANTLKKKQTVVRHINDDLKFLPIILMNRMKNELSIIIGFLFKNAKEFLKQKISTIIFQTGGMCIKNVLYIFQKSMFNINILSKTSNALTYWSSNMS